MDTLKAYFSSIDPHLFAHVSGKPRTFIRVFREQKFLSEEAFARKLCGENYDSGSYRRWKSQTLKILRALVFISATRGSSLVKKKYDECQKKFFIGQKFLREGKRSEGVRLVRQAYLLAKDHEFSHLACELASLLHHHHTYYERNKRLAELYARKVKQHLGDYPAEKEAEYHFYRIVAQMHQSSVSLKELECTVVKISECSGESVKYKVYRACAIVYHALYVGDYEQVILNCNIILECFEKKDGVYPAHYLFFLRNRGVAQIATAQHPQAAATFREAAQYTMNRPYNVATLEYYRALNAFHAGEYRLAYELYQNNRKCKIEDIRQQFAIMEAYLGFLIYTGYLPLEKRFRMGKYLNETFKAQEDKQGSNINILIAELLIYLARDRGKFIDRVDAVRHYSYRHLKGEATQRARWFLKMLRLLAHPQVNFHPTAWYRKAGKYADLLRAQPVRMGQDFAVEIIPFHVLLQMIEDKIIAQVA